MDPYKDGNGLEIKARHHGVMLELLLQLDSVCRKHDIRYMLFAGSAIGAVRHGGFIPWDDDLDVIMLRDDYERFLEAAAAELDASKYYVQAEFSKHWPMHFSKLRKNGTACIERYIPKDKESHRGIYIDIFPCDNLSDSPVVRRLQFLAAKAVIAKNLGKRGYITDSILKKVFIFFCRCVPIKHLHSFACGINLGETGSVHTFFAASRKYEKNVYPREWFTEIAMMPFEGGEYPVSAHYDALLTQLYGDYMSLPTPEERMCKVHADLVDTKHSYTDYLDYQSREKITVLTRSIR